MAYAQTQDQKLQMKIFAAEEKKASGGWSVHTPMSIRSGITNAQMTTGDALFKFVGAKDYEKKGGRYEDDLFGDAESYSGRKLIDPDIITVIAADRAHFQQVRLLSDAKASHPTTSDILLAPGLRGGRKPKPPKGYELVERPYWRQDLPSYAQLRDNACKLGIDIVGIASVSYGGKLEIEEQFFVPGARLAELIPPRTEAPRKSEAEIAAERRAKEVRSDAAFLAAKKIRDDKVDGRQFWKTMRPDLWRSEDIDGLGECHAVSVDVLVTLAEIDAQLEAGEVEYDRQEAEKVARREAEAKAEAVAAAALEARRTELLAMDPAPAVIQVDGVAHFQWESGAWADEQECSDEADECSLYDDLDELLEKAAGIGLTWPSIEAWEANPHGDNIVQEEEQAA